jgi:hypothetical protein
MGKSRNTDKYGKYRQHSNNKPRKKSHLQTIDEYCNQPSGSFQDFIEKHPSGRFSNDA